MNKFRRLLSMLLCLVMLATLLGGTTVSAASTTNYSKYNTPENSGDFARWNGSKVVKSSSTTKSEIKWMQAALNYCIANEGLDATYLDVDGSFGPASEAATRKFQRAAGLDVDGSFGPKTIKKMKSILKDGKVSFNSFKKQNILQSSAPSSSKYLSGSWYKLSRGNCGCCEGAYASEYGEHEYIQGGGCGVVALVSAIYNLGGTMSKSEIYSAIDNVLGWSYNKGYWRNGVQNNIMFANSDNKFGSTYNFKTSARYEGTSTDKTLINHIKNGGTAVVHVTYHFMAVVDYKVEDGVAYFLVFDPAPGSGTYWNSLKRKGITTAEGNWISLADLKDDGGTKGLRNTLSQRYENVEIDAYWLVSAD